MSRNVKFTALTPAILALAVTAAWGEKTDSQCEQGKCSASCTADACKSAKDGTVTVGTIFTSGPDFQCAGAESCKCGTDGLIAVSDSTSIDGSGVRDAACPCTAVALTATEPQCNETQCKGGTDGQYSATAIVAKDPSAHLALLHRRLVDEITKNASLEAQLQFHAVLAEAKEDFAKRMLKKETEVVNLHAELRLANERTQMSQKVVGAMTENARLKASVELTHDRYEMLKHVIAKKTSQQTEDLAVSLAKSKAENAKLMERIVILEKQLETLHVRLANKPENGQVE